jgi:hypothetical protein
MRAASRTEFLDRKFVGLRLLILAGRVVARLAGVARKRNQISHCNTPRKKYPSRKKPSRKIPAPLNRRSKIGAHDGIRTRDLFLTKEVLYRLSYMGVAPRCFLAAATLAPKWSGRRDSNPRPRAWKARALPTELLPLSAGDVDNWWRGEDSNLRRHKPADLQSAPFGHSGTSPRFVIPPLGRTQPMARIELATY